MSDIKSQLELVYESLVEALNEMVTSKNSQSSKNNTFTLMDHLYRIIEEIPEEDPKEKQNLASMWENEILPLIPQEKENYIRLRYGIRLEDLR